MKASFYRRLEALEQSVPTHPENDAEAAERRFVRGALIALSPEQLAAVRNHKLRLQQDPNAEPTPEEQAAYEAFKRNLEEYRSTGKLMTHSGWPVETMGDEWLRTGKEPRSGGWSFRLDRSAQRDRMVRSRPRTRY
jgi:hypothetical protein